MIRSFTQQEAQKFFPKARRVAHHPGFDILIAPAMDALPRLMVVTPKKLGNAVTRNKIRRQIKAVIHEEKLRPAAYDCAILVKKAALVMSFTEIKNVLKTLFANITH